MYFNEFSSDINDRSVPVDKRYRSSVSRSNSKILYGVVIHFLLFVANVFVCERELDFRQKREK
jgi:hypothetical protein